LKILEKHAVTPKQGLLVVSDGEWQPALGIPTLDLGHTGKGCGSHARQSLSDSERKGSYMLWGGGCGGFALRINTARSTPGEVREPLAPTPAVLHQLAGRDWKIGSGCQYANDVMQRRVRTNESVSGHLARGDCTAT
jgi:hypothetical protein